MPNNKKYKVRTRGISEREARRQQSEGFTYMAVFAFGIGYGIYTMVDEILGYIF